MKRTKVHPATKAFEDALVTSSQAEHYRLVLFVTGSTPRSLRAIQNIKELCEERLQGRYSIEVIDAYQHPDYLKPEQILVTPTLIRKLPFPVRRIVGDLSDRERVLIGLDIMPRAVAGSDHGS